MLTPNIQTVLEQLTLSFEQNSAIIDALDQEDKGLYPKWLDAHEHGPDIRTDSAMTMPPQRYLSLAIDLLKTCALDLTQAHIALATGPHSVRANARQCIYQYEQWISGDGTSLFDFSSCVELLQNELAMRTLDQLEIPRLNEQLQPIGQWLTKNPAQALDLFQRWEALFTPEPIVWKETIEEQASGTEQIHNAHRGPLVIRPRVN